MTPGGPPPAACYYPAAIALPGRLRHPLASGGMSAGSKSIAVVQGDRVVGIDRSAQRVELASGRALPYDHLVRATGSRPRTLDVAGANLNGVFTLRTLARRAPASP